MVSNNHARFKLGAPHDEIWPVVDDKKGGQLVRQVERDL
jgi:hypothetical protein